MATTWWKRPWSPSMSPERKSIAAPEILRHALAGKAHQRRRDVDRDDLGAAPRRFDGEGAGAAAGIVEATAREVGGQAPEQGGPHPVATGANRGADPRRPARPRSGAARSRPRCGRNRSRSATGAPRRSDLGDQGGHQSNPRKSKMSRSRMARPSQGTVPAQSVAARRRYSAFTASSSGEFGISNSVAFFRRERRMTSRSGK